MRKVLENNGLIKTKKYGGVTKNIKCIFLLGFPHNLTRRSVAPG
jgi:hypothetical protein